MRFLRVKEIQEITGLSKTTIWRLEKCGKFPKRHKISSSAVGWLESEIEKWIEQRTRPSLSDLQRNLQYAGELFRESRRRKKSSSPS